MEQIEFEYKGESVKFTRELVSENSAHPIAKSLGTEKVSEIGRQLLEYYSEKAVSGNWKSNSDKKKTKEFFEEVLGLSMPVKKEDLTFPNNPALYTTIVYNVVEKEFRPELIASGLIKSISVNPRGVEKIKFPLGKIRVALDLPDSGELPDPDNDDYTYATCDLKWIYSYEVITHQLIQQGIIDVVVDQMGELGDALSRKVDRDIILEFESASPSSGANNNYKALGESTTFSYDALIEGILRAEANNAKPDAIVTSSLTLLNFMKDTKVITALGYNSVDKGSIFPRTRDFFGTALLTTNQATAKNVYILDTSRTKYFVEASPIQVLDGRKSATVNWEIIALKCYGVKVINPKSVYRLVEQTAEDDS